MVTWSLRRPIAKGLRGQGIRPINTRTGSAGTGGFVGGRFFQDDGNWRARGHPTNAGSRPLGHSLALFSGPRERRASFARLGRRQPFAWQYFPYIARICRNSVGERGFLANIAVLPGQRRRGIATQLVAAALAQLRTYGERHVVLQVG